MNDNVYTMQELEDMCEAPVSQIDPKELSKENLESFFEAFKLELESRKKEEESKVAREQKEKIFNARCVIWDAEKRVADERTAKREKFEKIMEIIYKTNFDYNNAGIINFSKRSALKRKLDRLWEVYNRTVKEYEALNDKYEALHMADMSL